MPTPSTIDPELVKPLKRLPIKTFGPLTVRVMRVLDRLRPRIDMAGLLVTDVAVPGNDVGARVYRRADGSQPAPVVLWIHGGGYVLGNHKEDAWAKAFCGRLDCAVVSAGYRLAPEHPYPAALDDLSATVEWILSDPGFDSSRLVIAGESAGGGLAAALVQRLVDAGITLAGQVLVYPMLDDRTAVRDDIADKEHLIWNKASNRYGWASYLGVGPGSSTAPDGAVPARRETVAGLPSTWIGVGDLDLFHDENIAYAERLLAAGVECTLEVVPGAPHGFPSLAPSAEISRRFVESITGATAALLGQ